MHLSNTDILNFKYLLVALPTKYTNYESGAAEACMKNTMALAQAM
jgi:hypothetical protein